MNERPHYYTLLRSRELLYGRIPLRIELGFNIIGCHLNDDIGSQAFLVDGAPAGGSHLAMVTRTAP